MKFYSLALILSLIAVNAGHHLLNPINKPKGCSTSTIISNDFIYEKSLCFMKWDTNYFAAQEICQKRGMQLYVRDSSHGSTKRLNQFAKTVLKGNPKAEVFISGTQTENRCLTLRGDKTISYISCHLSCYFICEYYQKLTYVQCESYNTKFLNGDSDYITGGSIAEPQTCVYKQLIHYPRTIITVTPAVSNENIVLLDIEHTDDSKYLPTDVAAEFPNLSRYQAESSGVVKILKDNFAGLTKVRFVDLDFNRITTLAYEMFADLISLERINLNNNPIKRLSAINIFKRLKALHTVWLSNAGCIDFSVQRSSTAIVVPGNIVNTCKLI